MNNTGLQLVDLVKSQANILDSISKVVKLRKSSRTWQGLCPFHAEKTPSFHVYPDQGHFYCYGCHTHGDILTFTQRFYNLSFKEALHQLATELGIDYQKFKDDVSSHKYLFDILTQAAVLFHQNLLQSKKSDQHIKFLYNRGLNNRELIESYKVGWSSNKLPNALTEKYSPSELIEAGLMYEHEGHYKPRFYNRVLFPILSSTGAVLGFGGRKVDSPSALSKAPKYLNSPETTVFKKNQILFGHDKVRQQSSAPWVLVVEGYIDVIQLRAHGFPAVAPMGTALTQGQFEKLVQLRREIIFCFDGDKAGEKASFNALLMVLPLFKADTNISFVTLPVDKDPDQILMNEGKSYFVDLCKSRLKIVEYLFSSVRKLFPKSTPDDRMKFNAKVRGYIRTIDDPDARRGFESSLFQYERERFFSYKTKRSPEPQIALPKLMSNIEMLRVLFVDNPNELNRLSEQDKKLLNYSNDTTFYRLICGNIDGRSLEKIRCEYRVSYAKTLRLIKKDCVRDEIEHQLKNYKKNLLCLSVLALSQNKIITTKEISELLKSQESEIREAASVTPESERFHKVKKKAQMQGGVSLDGIKVDDLNAIYKVVFPASN